jgi:predicted MFS family arabinose efflux permease
LDGTTRRAIAVLAMAKLVANAGFRFVYPLLPAIGRGLGVDLARMGQLLSVRWVVGFSAPLSVRVVQRRGGSRRLLIAGFVAFATGSLVTAWLGAFWAAVTGFALIGLGMPALNIGAQTYIAQRVPYARRARALGILELSWAGGFMIGAPVAGWLIERWHWNVPFWTFGTLALVAAAAIALFLDPVDRTEAARDAAGDAAWGIVAPFLAVAAMTGFSLELVLVVLGSWLEAGFGLTVIALSGVGFLLGAAELVGEGAMVAFTDRIGKRNSYLLGLVVAAVGLGALGMVHGTFRPALGALFVVVFGLELAIISGIPLATEYRPANRSRFLAVFMVAGGIGRIGADLVGPVVFSRSGMTAVATMGAVSAALGAVALLGWVRDPAPTSPEI